MGYTVLARKWRPKNFEQLVGQSHVMQALANALDQNRLHHAYLFTGTRGVGKTTIARIFAKALNCVQGVSSKPCGVCENCRAIDEGKFIDLIEVDAASKTKVDDTREILENVQYAATQGRYKVYLIDEVHMLSKSSFNALLKTLEEPPEHVKFILATTDPHKLPITVLSRCLQFNLMRLTLSQLQTHLAAVLVQEHLPFDEAALSLIAKSADGSVRDALSLLDQAIAYGAGEIQFDAVQTMLGLVDQQFTYRLLQAVAGLQGQDLREVIAQMSAMGIDYQALLAQLIETLHTLSYRQVFGEAHRQAVLPEAQVEELIARLSPQRVQMLYQIALLTKQDMQLAPDIRIGFEMGMMRMLAFEPFDERLGKSDREAAVSSAGPQAATSLPSTENSVQSVAKSQWPQASMNTKPAMAAGDSDSPAADAPQMMNDMELQDAMKHLTSARNMVEPEPKKKAPSVELTPTPENATTKGKDDTFESQSITSSAETTFDHSQVIKQRLDLLDDEDGFAVASGADEALPQQSLITPSEPELAAIVSSQQSSESYQDSRPERIAEPYFQSGQETQVEPSVEPQHSVEASHNSPNLCAEGVKNLQNAEVPTLDQDSASQAISDSSLARVENAFPSLQSASQDFKASSSNDVPATMPEAVSLSQWIEWIEALNLAGMQREVAMNAILLVNHNRYGLALPPEQDFSHIETIKQELSERLSHLLQAQVVWHSWPQNPGLTPSQWQTQQADEKLAQAKRALRDDPMLQALSQSLNVQILENTFEVSE